MAQAQVQAARTGRCAWQQQRGHQVLVVRVQQSVQVRAALQQLRRAAAQQGVGLPVHGHQGRVGGQFKSEDNVRWTGHATLVSREIFAGEGNHKAAFLCRNAPPVSADTRGRRVSLQRAVHGLLQPPRLQPSPGQGLAWLGLACTRLPGGAPPGGRRSWGGFQAQGLAAVCPRNSRVKSAFGACAACAGSYQKRTGVSRVQRPPSRRQRFCLLQQVLAAAPTGAAGGAAFKALAQQGSDRARRAHARGSPWFFAAGFSMEAWRGLCPARRGTAFWNARTSTLAPGISNGFPMAKIHAEIMR